MKILTKHSSLYTRLLEFENNINKEKNTRKYLGF